MSISIEAIYVIHRKVMKHVKHKLVGKLVGVC